MTIEEAREKLIEIKEEMCACCDFDSGEPLECTNCCFCDEREALMIVEKALENAERYRWHDLRKDPDDLPKTKSRAPIPCMVILDGCDTPSNAKYEFYDGYGWGFYSYGYGWGFYRYQHESIIAWKEADLFEVDE